ncbi:hypothetical protein [Rhizobium tubonense]|nr:hypothetical protein [Rhizobium tubonense]
MERDRSTFRPVRILVAREYKTVHTVIGAGKLLMDGPAKMVQRVTRLK